MNINIELLHLYTSDRALALYTNPFRIGDFAYASDGRSAVRILVTADIEPFLHESANNIISKPFEVSPNQDETIDIKWLRAISDALPKVPVYTNCTACNGDGYTTCTNCGNKQDCEQCDGYGLCCIVGYDIDLTLMMPLNGVHFEHRYIVQLINAAQLLDAPIIWRVKKANGVNHFSVGNAHIIIASFEMY